VKRDAFRLVLAAELEARNALCRKASYGRGLMHESGEHKNNMTTKDKPFKVGETLIEWVGSFGRFPSSVRTVKKTFKKYIEDERGRKWRYDGFEHPMSNSSNKLERITDESLNEIRTWMTKRKINKVIDEVVRRVRRDELELEQLEAVLSMCLSLVSDEDRASVADDEEDDLVRLLAKHKAKR
jgi:uncharacterized membrane-anchored protein YjiN (DUF445 family)